MEFKARLVSWNEIVDWCLSIRKEIVNSYSPEIIIALSRGGLVPGRLLSDYLWIKDLYTIKTEHWGITASKDATAKIREDPSIPVKNRSVLIVDDITDTGKSMKLASDFIKKLGPEEVKTATMLHIDHSSFKPDYYATEVSNKEWTWFIFPWNIYEDVLRLLDKAMIGEHTEEEIITLLASNFDLNISRQLLQDLLSNFKQSGKVFRNNQKWRIIRTS